MPVSWRRHIPFVVGAAVSFCVLTSLSSVSPIVLVADGAYALALAIAAAGWGAHAARALLGGDAPLAKQVLLSLAIGLGVVAFLTLGLGVAGLLSLMSAWTLLAIGGLLGVARLISSARDRSATIAHIDGTSRGSSGNLPWITIILKSLLTVPIAICAAVMFFGATLPPGSLWLAEANGYDVLEYHLQVPREYFVDGRIHFLAHNVYAQFPQQVEMLYLLLMHLLGDPYAAAIPAQILHALCGVATVAALAAWSPAGWARWIVMLMAATVPYLAYVGCLAYVELAMTFFAAVAAGSLGDLICSARSSQPASSRGLLVGAGICAGLAAGCKYTALGLVVAPLVIALFLAFQGPFRRRVAGAAQFVLVAVITFSPWLIRNQLQTGNPVYPFAFEVFGGAAWSAEQAEQWRRGHQVAGARAGVAGRLALGWVETAASPMYGPAITAAAATALLFAGRRRAAWVYVVWLAGGLLAWGALTHMPGRFAIVLIVPACRLIAVGVEAAQMKLAGLRADGLAPPSVAGMRAVVVFITLAISLTGAVGGLHQLRKLILEQSDHWQRRAGIGLDELVGRTMEFVRAQPIVNDTPPEAHVKLIGDAAVFYVTRRMDYTVAFNRDPWLEFVGDGSRDRAVRSPADAVGWLVDRGVSHVVFSWSEITRLGRTYGFAEFVTPAWAEALQSAGLRRISQARDAAGNPLRDVFEVPDARSPSSQPR